MFYLSGFFVKLLIDLNNFLAPRLETSMGREINSQVTKSENEYVRAIFRMGQIVVERLFSPFLYSDFVFRMTPLGREMFNVIRILHGVTSKVNTT